MTRLGRQMAVGVLVAIGSVGRASAQAVCDRTCLRTMMDQYLAAVIKHDPKAAPLAVGFRQTENAINVSPGGGVWKTVTGLGKMQRRYLDPVSGQAGYYGLIEEDGNVSLATVRLRIENTRDELGMLGAALRGWRVPRAVFGRRAPHRASQRRWSDWSDTLRVASEKLLGIQMSSQVSARGTRLGIASRY